MHIELTDYQIKLCRLFAEESAKTQQKIEFGNKSTTPRALEEIAHDTYIGKVAEAAIVTLAWREFGYKIPVNYEIYPRGQYDDEDISEDIKFLLEKLGESVQDLRCAVLFDSHGLGILGCCLASYFKEVSFVTNCELRRLR